jgi:nucleoside-triphosphatase THEP1
MTAIPVVTKQVDEVQKQQLEQARKTSDLIIRDHNAAKEKNKQLEMEVERLKTENQELLKRKINPDIVVAEHPGIQQIKHEEKEIVDKNI